MSLTLELTPEDGGDLTLELAPHVCRREPIYRQPWDADVSIDGVLLDVGAGASWGYWQRVGEVGIGQARVTLGEGFTVPPGSSMFVLLPFPVPQDQLYDCGYALAAYGPTAENNQTSYGNITGGNLSGAFGLPPGTVPANYAIIDSPSAYVGQAWQEAPGGWGATVPIADPQVGTFWRFVINAPIDLDA